MNPDRPRRPLRRTIFASLLLLTTAAVSLLALLIPQLAPMAVSAQQAGQVAQQDLTAPADITFESTLLTEQRRLAAAQAVPMVYTAADTTVARQQLERLHDAMAYISSVRSDRFATQEQKRNDLSALQDALLSQQSIDDLLALSEPRWLAVQQEAKLVLEQGMRSTLRDDQIKEARQRVPAIISLSLSQDQAAITAQLVQAFLIPNSLFSTELTQAAQEEARQAVAPVAISYKAGEIVVPRGRVITALHVEALEAMGIGQPRATWQDVVSAAALAALTITFMVFYMMRRSTTLRQDLRGLGLVAVLYLSFLVAGRLVIPSNPAIAFLFPLAAYSMAVASLFGAEPAMISSLPLAILITYRLSNALDLTLFYMFGGFFGALTLGRGRRILSFFWAAASVAISGVIIVAAYRMPQAGAAWLNVLPLTAAPLLNGIVSAGMAMLLQFLLAQFLGTTTAMQLMELSRPDHPLLQFILRNAPGTYQHSLQVANLAEQAAERIGADTLLTRVGAIYHDAGKALNPIFFIENQPPGNVNPHNDLDPETSAQTILRHVADGLELSRTHRLPRRVQDFMAEHHGTMLARYQYVKAVEAAGGDESKVDADQFRYPGPRPKSRETGILMLADGCEARVRAERPKDTEALRKLIRKVVDERVAQGQLDKTPLTLRDLERIVDSFTGTLSGIYHPRIQYPELDEVLDAARSASHSQKTVPIPRTAPFPAPEPENGLESTSTPQ